MNVFTLTNLKRNCATFLKYFMLMYILVMLARLFSTANRVVLFELQGFQLTCSVLFAAICALWNYNNKSTFSILAAAFLWFGAACCKIGAGMILTEREIVQSIEAGLILSCCFSVILSAINYIKPNKIRCLLRSFFLALFALIYLLPLLVIGYYFVSDKHMLSANILLTLFQTNLGEIKAYLVEQNILLWSGAILVILFIISAILYLLSSCQTHCNKVAFVFNCLFAIITSTLLLPKLNSNFIINMYAKVMDTLQEYKQYQQISEQRQERLVKLQNIFHSVTEPQLHILVIGEATVRDHMSAFGYSLPTTPWLDNIAEQNANVIIFPKAYSNHVQTVMAIQQALTSQNQYNHQPLVKATSLTEAASASGYQTFWISIQQHYTTHDTPITAIANGTDKQIYINDYVGKKLRTMYYDEKLADSFPPIAENSKMFIIFHLMGCHNVYADRYPEQFSRFTQNQDERINHYDNCIMYNDYVLSLLYKTAATHKNFMSFTFLSDHGEDPDHGLTHDYSKFTWNMTHIPLFTVLSEKYAQQNPDILVALQSNRNRFWTSDFLYEMMLHILGVAPQNLFDSKHDLASAEYNLPADKLTIINNEKHLLEDNTINHSVAEQD